MSLETTTYIDGLITTSPTGSDQKREGDNHIRLLKSTIKNTFPNITGAVTATHTELNYVDGVTSSIQTQLDDLTDFGTALDSAKLDDSVATTQRVIGRKTAGSGPTELVSLTDFLDWASTTQGSILYRGAATWAALSPGTDGQVLKTNGAGANPAWETSGTLTKLGDTATTSGTSVTISGIPTTATKVEFHFNGLSFSGADELRMQLGTSGPAYQTSGYIGCVSVTSTSSGTLWATAGTHAILDVGRSNTETLHTIVTLTKLDGYKWGIHSYSQSYSAIDYGATGTGQVTLIDDLSVVQFSGTSGGSFDGGSVTTYYYG
jgi:hypothetical protein